MPLKGSSLEGMQKPEVAALCKRFGAALKVARRRMGYTQEQLAERLGLSANFIAHLERGSRRPSLDTLVLLSTELDVPIEKLLTSEPVSASTSASQENPLVQRLSRLGKDLPHHELRSLVNFLEGMHHRTGRDRSKHSHRQ